MKQLAAGAFCEPAALRPGSNLCSGVTLNKQKGLNSGSREFKSELWLPVPPAELFSYFAEAGNLDAITPPWLHFRILTPTPFEIREGVLIEYRLRLHRIPLRWCTRINVWRPPHEFVDEQISGPFRQWVHEHTFEAVQGGTLTRDHVRYAAPLDFLLHRWFVRPDIERIFRFRARMLRTRFGGSRAAAG